MQISISELKDWKGDILFLRIPSYGIHVHRHCSGWPSRPFGRRPGSTIERRGRPCQWGSLNVGTIRLLVIAELHWSSRNPKRACLTTLGTGIKLAVLIFLSKIMKALFQSHNYFVAAGCSRGTDGVNWQCEPIDVASYWVMIRQKIIRNVKLCIYHHFKLHDLLWFLSGPLEQARPLRQIENYSSTLKLRGWWLLKFLNIILFY